MTVFIIQTKSTFSQMHLYLANQYNELGEIRKLWCNAYILKIVMYLY